MPDHDQDWAKTSISFITNRIYDASRPDLNERFLADYGDRLWYGTFEVGLDKRTAIGADHWDSYHVFQFSVEDEAQFWTALDVGLANDEKIIIMIHGFKTSMVDALLRAATLKMDLAFAGQVIAFSWPADFRVSRYLKDGVNARRSVDDFINVVNRILSLRSGSSIYVISHSMGAELVVEAIAELVDLIKGDNTVELIFAAPDVDSVIFEKEIKKIAEKIQRVTLYASDNDIAFRCAAMIRGDYTRAGQEGEALLILPSVETVDATALVDEQDRHKYDSCVIGAGLVFSGFAESDFEHAYPFNDRRVVSDLAAIILGDLGAAERFGLLEQWKGTARYHRIRP